MLSFLYGQIQSRVTPDLSGKQLIDEFLTSEFPYDEMRESLRPRLVLLLEQRESSDTFKKAQRLRRGFSDNAISFGSFIDLRPCYTKKRDAMQFFIPIIQMEIGIEQDGNRKSLFFNLDRRSLEDMKSEIASIERKLAVLDSAPEFAQKLRN